MKILRILGVPAAAVTILVLGCTDAPSPTDPSTLSDPLSSLETDVELLEEDGDDESDEDDDDLLQTVTTLRRTEQLEESGTCAVRTVGPAGGTMECEDAGLRVVFPAGALSEETEISIHVPDPKLVGYEFAPHGLTFDEDVELHQDLEDTEIKEDSGLLSQLVGAYVDEFSSVVEALEVLPVDVEDAEKVVIRIRHFSGYICATN